MMMMVVVVLLLPLLRVPGRWQDAREAAGEVAPAVVVGPAARLARVPATIRGRPALAG